MSHWQLPGPLGDWAWSAEAMLEAADSPARTVSDTFARCEVVHAPPGLDGMPDEVSPLTVTP
jgi:transglutaminase-like putative cysteine protease